MAFGNNPLLYVDPEGLDWRLVEKLREMWEGVQRARARSHLVRAQIMQEIAPSEAQWSVQRDVDFWRSTQTNSLAADFIERHVRRAGPLELTEEEMKRLAPSLSLRNTRIGKTCERNEFLHALAGFAETGAGQYAVVTEPASKGRAHCEGKPGQAGSAL